MEKNLEANEYVFSIDELRALYRVLEFEYITYDDLEARMLVRKIREAIEEHELGTTSSQPT
jgi:hypothetical protein